MARSDLSAFYGPNAGYVLELYDRYRDDPASVDAATRTFFEESGFTPELAPPSSNGATATATAPPSVATATPPVDLDRVVAAAALAQAIREYGHLGARLDPLGGDPPGASDLELATYGLTEGDLERLPASVVGGPVAEGMPHAAAAIARLRATYCGTAGFDFDHIVVPGERLWIRDAIESGRFAQPLAPKAKRAVLARLTAVESFERFLHQTYLGQKRFSIEGTDILVPMLDEIVQGAAQDNTREVVIGMAHRGRLNVMTHVLGKPYAAILAAFEGGQGRSATAPSDAAPDTTGDVKYHLGARRARTSEGDVVEVPLVLAPNPSHLEFVNPVVVGMVRASQDQRDQPGPPRQDVRGSVGILLHGDAAFPGQGIVAETLNLNCLAGYTTGGTIHLIVNNQIGFTTNSPDARSTLYASDLAKGFEIPVVHVNADDPEACLMAARFAMAYRATFFKDVLIDLIGYRRWGHNEGDEPAFTQPRMYAGIAKHPTVRQLWADRLVAEGVLSAEEAQGLQQAALDRLAAIRRSVTEGTAELPEDENPPRGERREVETAVPAERLRAFHEAIHALPAGFTPSPKLARQWERRRGILDAPDGKVDWAHAEALAFAAILADGTPIRLTGQDAQRGTFSQRHLVLHDAATGDTHVPLHAVPGASASFAVYNSPLSEAATVGFEYGYSVHAPGALVLWEAQFGDFVNGAQVLIDQFLVAARAKWGQEPALVMLLPHGFEGQGPEHSSGRLERFLQLWARDNIRVANCTTAAQYFHLLRRQAARLTDDPRPLIVMTPKSLLRHPLAASDLQELASGTFRPVLDDPLAGDAARAEAVTRLVLCSGKVAVDLEGSAVRAGTTSVAVVRIEQLAPFQNTALRAVIERYPNRAELLWLQEEPRNMGAWGFVEPRLRELVSQMGLELPIRYVGRPERASPAEGSAERHAAEQARIVGAAFADAPAVNGRSKRAPARDGVGTRGNGAGGGTTRANGAKTRTKAANRG